MLACEVGEQERTQHDLALEEHVEDDTTGEEGRERQVELLPHDQPARASLGERERELAEDVGDVRGKGADRLAPAQRSLGRGLREVAIGDQAVSSLEHAEGEEVDVATPARLTREVERVEREAEADPGGHEEAREVPVTHEGRVVTGWEDDIPLHPPWCHAREAASIDKFDETTKTWRAAWSASAAFPVRVARRRVAVCRQSEAWAMLLS